ncbi:MAG: serine/threonine protein kinase [Candidatus Melainabacteria bacterium]|nr:serine/threonine protein kinase [Candidatus Melainabacteria bacterium]
MFAGNTERGLDQRICVECNRQFTGLYTACPHDGALLRPIIQDPLIGTVLAGHYEILEVLGQGGMGVVYRGKHSLMERIVAIKMLLSQLISDTNSVKRFQQESKAAARLKHPHIIDVYDFGISPAGQPYIVMEFLEGTPLSDLIKKEGQIGVERSIKLISQACDALDHAHKQGVVHRDLKPSNIVLTQYDEEKDYVKVVDFGVAKLIEAGNNNEGQRLTQAGEVCGSPVYMSPEQCMGQDLDARSDIYSMGIVLYETLTGKLPILGKTMVDTMSKHISEPPVPFNEARPDLYIPERLEWVVLKAMAKDPAQRHQTMEEFKLDLDLAIPRPGRSTVLRTQEQKSPVDSVLGFVKEVPIWTWAAAVALMVAAGGIIIHAVTDNKASTAPAVQTAAPPQAHPAPSKQPPASAATTPSATTTPSAATTPARVEKPAATEAPVAKTPKPPPAAKPIKTAASRETTGEVEKPHGRRAYSTTTSVSDDSDRPVRRAHDSTEVLRRAERKAARRAYSSHSGGSRPAASSGGGDPFAALMRSRSGHGE